MSGGTSVRQFFKDTMKPLLLHDIDELEAMAKEIDDQHYPSGNDGPSLELHLSSLRTSARTHEEQGSSTATLQTIADLVDQGVSQGRQDDQFSSIVEAILKDSKWSIA